MNRMKRRTVNAVLRRMLFGSDHQPIAWFELFLVTFAAMLIWVYQSTLAYQSAQEYFFWPMLGPILLALRYGFGRGMISFVLLLIGFSLWQTFHGQEFAISMSVAVGTAMMTMIVGEFRDHWHDINERFELNHRYMEQKLRSFTQNYHLLKVSHDQLEQRVAGKQVSLRTSIKLLHQEQLKDQGDRPVLLAERSLQVMNEIITMQQAGLYRLVNGEIDPVPLATLGEHHQLDATDPMVVELLKSKDLLSPADLLEQTNLRYQLAIPLLNLRGEMQGFVLAERIKFVQLTNTNIALIALLAGYIANFLSNDELVPILKQEQRQLFRFYLQNQQDYITRYGVDSTLVVFTDNSIEQNLPLDHVTDYRRGADIYWSCQNSNNQQALCVLLPMTTLMEAKQFVERIRSILHSLAKFDDAELLVNGPMLISGQHEAIENLMNELGAYDEDLADNPNAAV